MAWSKLAWKAENRYWFSVVVDNTTRTLILLLNLPSQSSRYTPRTHFPHSACPLDNQVTWWLPTLTSARAIHLGFACCAFPTLLSAEQWKCCHSVASIMSIILEMCILKPKSQCAEIQESGQVAKVGCSGEIQASQGSPPLMIRRWRTVCELGIRIPPTLNPLVSWSWTSDSKTMRIHFRCLEATILVATWAA